MGARHRPQYGRIRASERDIARGSRPSFRGRRMARGTLLRLAQGHLPALCAVRMRARGACTVRSGRQTTNSFPRAPVRGRDRTVQFPGDQPGGSPACRRVRRREHRAGTCESDWRRATRTHHHDRRVRVRGRPQPRGNTGKRGVSKRLDRVDPVRTDDRRGLQAAAGHCSTLHQQVLHSRSRAGKLLCSLRGRRWPHHIHDLLAQHFAGARAADLG